MTESNNNDSPPEVSPSTGNFNVDFGKMFREEMDVDFEGKGVGDEGARLISVALAAENCSVVRLKLTG